MKAHILPTPDIPDEHALEVRLRVTLKSARFMHTKGVVKTAQSLAMHHGVDPARARLLAWLHDCAKALSREAMEPLLGLAGADQDERKVPALWHAPVGAFLARRDYGVVDAEILQGIRWHSTGCDEQTALQKVLFVADYIEPGRPAWPELPFLRRLARRDLDAAWREVLRNKLIDLLRKGRPVHSRSVDAYNRSLNDPSHA